MEQMQSDRLYSYAEGLKMWLDAPVFGAGLGAFINEQIISSGVPLVIHSTPLWLLVETGIVGFILIMSVPVVIMLHLWRHPVRKWCAQDRGIFLLLITLALMSILHELSYQRIFWLSLGMFAARYWTHQAPPKTDSER